MRKPVNRTPAWVGPVATIGALAIVVVAFLAYRYMTTPAPPPPATAATTAQILTTITSLPASEFDQVGMGSATNIIQKVSGSALLGPAGKPLIFYYGAEFCPFCAAERWPMIIALSRFGTFSGLKTTTSSSTDVFPNTPTFTFHGATYASTYVELQTVEVSDRNQKPLETPTSAQEALVVKYNPNGTIPFVDMGNKFVIPRATYQPDPLTGMTWQDIATALMNPESPQSAAIVGSANLVTAGICVLTSNQPSTVCTPAIQAIEAKL